MSRPRTKAATKKSPARGERDPVNIHFGEAVRAAREAAGLSQRDLGQLAGVPQPDLPGIERAETSRIRSPTPAAAAD